MRSQLRKNDYRFSSLVETIIPSHQLDYRRNVRASALVPGVSMNFSGDATHAGSEKLHQTRLRQFAVTGYGELDVETSVGSKAHPRTGDFSFVEDVQGKGRKTFERGAQSVFLRVPEGFDVKQQ